MIPIVMAGGFGTRIRPLSANRPKPMLEVVNRPILERVLLHLTSHGLDEAVLLTYYDPEKIRAAFGDGSRLGMKLHYYTADQDYGTAGAVAHGAELAPADEYLVLSGDVLCDFDLGAIMDFHHERKAAVTIALTHVPNPLQFGIVIVDADGRVRRFLEKPTWGEVFSDTVNTGLYVLSATALAEVPRHESCDFSRELFPKLLAAGAEMYGYIARGYWRDIGDPESYLAAHRDYFEGTLHIIPAGELSQVGGKPIWIEGSAEVDPGVEVRGTVVLADGCRIGPGVRLEDVVLGAGTVIEGRSELRRVVIWDHAVIGAGARIEDSVLGAHVQVGADSVIEAG
ncbi:MAG: NDP-sugar synthase, partial [Acidobacteria bacterium]|nr:NDP-sugar synthase [Acidobacteriota bacterium]